MVPEPLRLTRASEWAAKRRGRMLTSFLEGPSFDREGNLFCVDIAHSRLLKVAPDLQWSVFAEYDGEPCGLKIHRDGRIFVADSKYGILSFDPVTASRRVVVDGFGADRFKGLNDLTFSANGDLCFTDMGPSSLGDPTGRVFRLRASGTLDLLFSGLEGPNGLVLNNSEDVLFVAVTRANRIVRLPLLPDYGGVTKAGIFIQLSGGPAGPDGMALDEEGNLAIVHGMSDSTWLFSRLGEPLFRIRSCAGAGCTNVAYGGPDRKTLFITEAGQGAILKVDLPTPGKLTYALG